MVAPQTHFHPQDRGFEKNTPRAASSTRGPNDARRADCRILLLVLPAAGLALPEPEAARPTTKRERSLAIAAKPWTGAFDGMLKRRMMRVAIPYSRSL
jgi:hypothetical protein